MARTQVTCDGEPLTHQVSVKNQTYLLGTDGLGRDLFIRIDPALPEPQAVSIITAAMAAASILALFFIVSPPFSPLLVRFYLYRRAGC